MNDVLFSSKRVDWETPDDLFTALDGEFNFTLDAAASPPNAKCKRFLCEDHWYRSQASTDALDPDVSWNGRVWLNPPYGREAGPWIAKAKQEAYYNAQVVVMLLPSRTDVAWWHDYIWDSSLNRPQAGVEVRFLRGRLKFKGARASAPFPSVVSVFRSPVYRPEGGPNA